MGRRLRPAGTKQSSSAIATFCTRATRNNQSCYAIAVFLPFFSLFLSRFFSPVTFTSSRQSFSSRTPRRRGDRVGMRWRPLALNHFGCRSNKPECLLLLSFTCLAHSHVHLDCLIRQWWDYFTIFLCSEFCEESTQPDLIHVSFLHNNSSPSITAVSIKTNELKKNRTK